MSTTTTAAFRLRAAGPGRHRRPAHAPTRRPSGPRSASCAPSGSSRTSPAGSSGVRSTTSAAWRRSSARSGVLGMHLEGYGCAGMSATEYGLACLELEATDSGIRSLVSVQGSLAMFAIWRWGSEEQKHEWLPRMATGEAIGCFGLTEPDVGSDPGSMRTRARRDGVRLGARRSQDVDHQRLRRRRRRGLGADRRRGPRLRRPDRHARVQCPGDQAQACRCARRSPASSCWTASGSPSPAVLPEVRGLKGPLSCLNEARYGIVWGAMGAARSSLEAALSYASERAQFGRPISGFQLTQQKLVDMNLEYTKGVCSPCTSAAARTPARSVPSRSAWASSTTSARRSTSAAPPAPCSAPTASRSSTPSSGT